MTLGTNAADEMTANPSARNARAGQLDGSASTACEAQLVRGHLGAHSSTGRKECRCRTNSAFFSRRVKRRSTHLHAHCDANAGLVRIAPCGSRTAATSISENRFAYGAAQNQLPWLARGQHEKRHVPRIGLHAFENARSWILDATKSTPIRIASARPRSTASPRNSPVAGSSSPRWRPRPNSGPVAPGPDEIASGDLLTVGIRRFCVSLAPTPIPNANISASIGALCSSSLLLLSGTRYVEVLRRGERIAQWRRGGCAPRPATPPCRRRTCGTRIERRCRTRAPRPPEDDAREKVHGPRVYLFDLCDARLSMKQDRCRHRAPNGSECSDKPRVGFPLVAWRLASRPR